MLPEEREIQVIVLRLFASRLLAGECSRPMRQLSPAPPLHEPLHCSALIAHISGSEVTVCLFVEFSALDIRRKGVEVTIQAHREPLFVSSEAKFCKGAMNTSGQGKLDGRTFHTT
jgi:hypothetical protein